MPDPYNRHGGRILSAEENDAGGGFAGVLVQDEADGRANYMNRFSDPDFWLKFSVTCLAISGAFLVLWIVLVAVGA